jgi:hypothetical protein
MELGHSISDEKCKADICFNSLGIRWSVERGEAGKQAYAETTDSGIGFSKGNHAKEDPYTVNFRRQVTDASSYEGSIILHATRS